ncbi:uncharacterized protein MYCGRDRAFT_109348 [Zymoseptoria tritici IPO323]|uniref:Uncharacterized protein n=1 Tax=Zymoseptoria tritici (strain CBS 115943 / IPO323) TaxID=336722 RepID=F9XAM8_ZYMTI|nr:uncharacterized protein MYCGRDRAFT_109348 [Zymoseptoria tritici IPO323]EGP87744.1 hypothetical protein MYCGRDRAFT_109348 [Zymoseptoria tritici IPO323]
MSWKPWNAAKMKQAEDACGRLTKDRNLANDDRDEAFCCMVEGRNERDTLRLDIETVRDEAAEADGHLARLDSRAVDLQLQVRSLIKRRDSLDKETLTLKSALLSANESLCKQKKAFEAKDLALNEKTGGAAEAQRLLRSCNKRVIELEQSAETKAGEHRDKIEEVRGLAEAHRGSVERYRHSLQTFADTARRAFLGAGQRACDVEMLQRECFGGELSESGPTCSELPKSIGGCEIRFGSAANETANDLAALARLHSLLYIDGMQILEQLAMTRITNESTGTTLALIIDKMLARLETRRKVTGSILGRSGDYGAAEHTSRTFAMIAFGCLCLLVTLRTEVPLSSVASYCKRLEVFGRRSRIVAIVLDWLFAASARPLLDTQGRDENGCPMIGMEDKTSSICTSNRMRVVKDQLRYEKTQREVRMSRISRP